MYIGGANGNAYLAAAMSAPLLLTVGLHITFLEHAHNTPKNDRHVISVQETYLEPSIDNEIATKRRPIIREYSPVAMTRERQSVSKAASSQFTITARAAVLDLSADTPDIPAMILDDSHIPTLGYDTAGIPTGLYEVTSVREPVSKPRKRFAKLRTALSFRWIRL